MIPKQTFLGRLMGMTTLLVVLAPTVIQGWMHPNVVERRPSFSTSTLHAKKVINNPRSSSGGGGFGSTTRKKESPPTVVVTTNEKKDDYALFPPLDPKVAATLIPSSSNTTTTTDTRNEMHQRLDQIYGFPHFNYDNHSSSSRSRSFPDLLTLSSSSSDDDSSIWSSIRTSLDCIPAFPEVQILHMDPLVLTIPDFFTADECDHYIALSHNAMSSPSPTVGKDVLAKAQRTSTTWYHSFASVPQLVAKASRLLGLTTAMDQWEEPQTVRYQRNEQFTWHLDALGPTAEQQNSGQRVATLLVYLTELASDEGGATQFRDLTHAQGRLTIRPQKGTALLFFPAAGGIPETPYDIRTLHCGQRVSDTASCDKWIAQLWLRERPYVPTAPPGNRHADALEAIHEYCQSFVGRKEMK